MEPDPQAKAMVGPRDPLTDDERIGRLAKLDLAVGLDLARAAMLVAYPALQITEPDTVEAPTVVAQESSEP